MTKMKGIYLVCLLTSKIVDSDSYYQSLLQAFSIQKFYQFIMWVYEKNNCKGSLA